MCSQRLVSEWRSTASHQEIYGAVLVSDPTCHLLPVNRVPAGSLPAFSCSSSPVSEEGKAPSSLDLRLNAAARQCAALTPRSEKALSCISQEFDNIFSQLTSASESGTPAQTQVTRTAALSDCCKSVVLAVVAASSGLCTGQRLKDAPLMAVVTWSWQKLLLWTWVNPQFSQ